MTYHDQAPRPLPYDPTKLGLECWLTPRRAELMERLWARPCGYTVKQLRDLLRADGDPLEITSIQTHLERLRAMGLVNRQSHGGPYVYRAACSRAAFHLAQHQALIASLGADDE